MTRLKVLASVSTLAIGLALSAGAYAIEVDSNNLGQGNASGGSNATTASGNEIASGNADSSTHATNVSKDNGNTATVASGNSIDNNNNQSRNTNLTKTENTNVSKDNGNTATVASGNSIDNNNNQSRNTNLTKSAGDNTGAGNASNGGKNIASNNTANISKDNGNTANVSKDNGNAVASNNTLSFDNGNNQSRNFTKNTTTNTTTNTTLNVTATVSNEDLQGSVSGVFIKAGDTFHGDGTATTGGIAGSTYNGFAGIQTASSNTGLASVNQAATSIAANANVSFGTP
jgi:hypothetical protein